MNRIWAALDRSVHEFIMRIIWTIAKREYKLYFASPAAFIAAFLILLVVGYLFYGSLVYATNQQVALGVEVVFNPLAFMLMLITPALTTRLLSGERSAGTIELLLTAPVREWQLVLGKWLGALLFVASILLVSVIYPFILNRFIVPGIDTGPLISGYLGLLLFSAALIAVGVFISALFSNQIATFLATLFVLIFLWWMFGLIGQVGALAGGASQLFRYLDFQSHFYDNLILGILDLRDIVYYLSITIVALFLSAVTLESRRWR